MSAALQVAAGETSSAPVRLELWDGVALGDPVFLVLVPLAIAAVLFGHRRAARSSVRAPLAGLAQASLRQRLLFLPGLLEALALCLVAVALARPLAFDVLTSITSEGVDIVLCVDRSGSMEIPDLEQGRTRLDVVKRVAGDFAERRMSDTEGASDNVALLAFARFPKLVCPFTLDVGALRGFLDQVELATHPAEAETAIGAALAKAVAVLQSSDAESRVVVLLTDGENTVDEIRPEEAIVMAKEAGVRVHTILAARFVYEVDRFNRLHATTREPDTRLLEAIARETDGRFFRAKDSEDLEGIYAEIEALERTPREEQRRIETRDLYPWTLLGALVSLTLARLLAGLGLRRSL